MFHKVPTLAPILIGVLAAGSVRGGDSVAELPRPNSGTFTFEQAEKREGEILSNRPTMMIRSWKNPYSGFSIHIHQDDSITVYGYSGLGVLAVGGTEKELNRLSVADVTRMADAIPLSGNPAGILITSDTPLRQSKNIHKILEEIFVPSIQIFYVAGQKGQPPAAEHWPQQNGPGGNFAPPPCGREFLDDVSQARQVWLSETRDLGYAKGSVSGYLQNLARWDGHPGSCSAPIIADGKVFVTTFRPSDEAWAEEQPQYKKWLDDPPKKPDTEEEKARMKRNLRLLADDMLVAIDLKTGKTAWSAVEEGVGLNRYMGKRQGYNVSPVYHDGTVFSLGTLGVLRAYRASDGKRLWEKKIDVPAAQAEGAKARALARKTLTGGMGWNVSLTVADGVLVVPLFHGKADLGLRGVDPKNGDTLWEFEKVCSRHATPAVWSHDGLEYVVCATTAGELRLIDPKQKKVCWSIDGLGANHCSLLTTDEHVILNVGTDAPRKPGGNDFFARIGAYRLHPDKATFAWALVDHPSLYYSTWMDSCARRFYAAARGKVYYRAIGTEKNQGKFLIINEKGGRVLADMEFNSPAPLFYPLGERLLMIRDASHSETDLAMFNTDPEDFRQLTDFWRPPHQGTTAYEVAMECPIVDGRIYMRTKDGRVACYDLTKPQP